MRLASPLTWLLISTVGAAQAAPSQLHDVRLWDGPDKTRVVFDLSGAVKHNVFELSDPSRVVIDLNDTRVSDRFPLRRDGKGVVQKLRAGERGKSGFRVVLDLGTEATIRTFPLPPAGDYGHRLVVDLVRTQATESESAPVEILDEKPIVIAIDPGHGGEDPGAHGPTGLKEKDIALQIAKRLAHMIDATPGMRAVLTRSGDYYVGLKKRIEIAQRGQADLFISIHADAFKDGRARGSSIYVLSPKGATSAHARHLADRENAADLVGGIILEDKDRAIQDLLVEISQASAIEASVDVGARILEAVGRVNHLHKDSVQQANFAVLKAPDIPSVLVETAFISNKREERALRDPRHQHKVASALMAGVRGYFRDYRPQRNVAGLDAVDGPMPGPREHIIRRGETLSKIARRYQVSLATLRDANRLRSDRIHVGDVLTIPGS